MAEEKYPDDLNRIDPDTSGEIDDVAWKSDLFRLERMTKDCVWVAAYYTDKDGKDNRICFYISADSEKPGEVRILMSEGPEDEY